MSENRKLKVFLCHSKDDKPKVRELYRHLVADGFDGWLDEEKLVPGQEWDLEIRKAVRDTDVVVVCLSNSSITKAGYVQKEIRFALDVADEQPEGATFIIPARLEECKTPSRLSKWQWVNLFEETGYEKLKEALVHQAHKTGNLVIPILHLQNELSSKNEPQMVRIPAGTFLMGSRHTRPKSLMDKNRKPWDNNEKPQHTVELSEYYIGKFPVTNLIYLAFINDARYKPPSHWQGNNFETGSENHPVVNVTWADANAFTLWLRTKTHKLYRLPTEAEWEKAARGTDGRIWPWGNEPDITRCNVAETNLKTTSPIGAFSPQGDSPYGCADMIGNVWEWCGDFYNEDEYKKRNGIVVKDPNVVDGIDYVIRGGAYNNSLVDIRCAIRRHDGLLDETYVNLGFRVALSLDK